MTPHDRAVKKQLLLMKGEVLRVKLRLELDALRRHPLGLAGEGLKSLTAGSKLSSMVATLGGLFPDGKLRRWLQWGTRAFVLWQAGRRFWPRS